MWLVDCQWQLECRDLKYTCITTDCSCHFPTLCALQLFPTAFIHAHHALVFRQIFNKAERRNLRSVLVWLKHVQSEKRDTDSQFWQNTRKVWNDFLSRWQRYHAWCTQFHLQPYCVIFMVVLGPHCKHAYCILRKDTFCIDRKFHIPVWNWSDGFAAEYVI